jgi:membrane-bound serine protease (ClpP class)
VSTLPTHGWVPQTAGRRSRRFAGALLMLAGLAVLLAAAARPAAAQSTEPAGDPAVSAGQTEAGHVPVVTLTGLVDPILADLMRRSLADAAAGGARALIFQVDLEGSVIPDEELVDLVRAMRDSPVPTHVWIGPSGSQLSGEAAWLIGGADKVAMAPGTTIGDSAPPPAPLEGALAARVAPLTHGSLDAERARSAGVTNTDGPTLGIFFNALPEVVSRVVTEGGESRREPVTQAVFSKLSLLSSFLHTAASPAVAYLLLAAGLSLLIFELFTAGVGVAGAVGATAFVLACYGLATLPTRWWALALLLASMVAFAVDVQTGVPRFWTGTGLVLFTLGTLTLYDGVSMSWLTMAVGIGGVALAFLAGMPSMVRTRFSTPTIGRSWMVGEEGRAISDIAPDGVVQIQGAPWRAFTHRHTPIEALDKVRVIGIEGLVLEVEPIEGGARDYRERRPSAAAADAGSPRS